MDAGRVEYGVNGFQHKTDASDYCATTAQLVGLDS